MGRRLVSKALPGPVAFQIKLSESDLAAARARLKGAADETLQEGYITLRCPDSNPTQQVLTQAGGAVAIIGAGTAAQPGIYELADLPETLLAARISAAIDGGPTRYKRSSTLVRLTGEAFSVVRPGVIDERIIQKMADFQILFICSGNTCRSPMAAALAAKILADKLGISPSELPLRHIVVQSAGLHANRGMRAAREAVDALSPLKVDLSTHISQPATTELLRRADLIYTMTEAHREEIVDLVPAAAQKTYRLDPQGDVEDPIGSGLGVYQEVARRLVELLQHRLSELPV
jgi:protein-tyrosine-phosphatase